MQTHATNMQQKHTIYNIYEGVAEFCSNIRYRRKLGSRLQTLRDQYIYTRYII